MGYVYKVTNNTNFKSYIGQTKKNFESSKSYYGSGVLILAALKKHGKDSFTKVIVEHSDDQSRLDECESYWIKKLNTLYPNGYNLESGGKNNFIHSKKSNKKNKRSNLGRVAWNKGLTGNKSHIFGTHQSEEAKEKNRQAHIGKIPWNKDKKGVQTAWNKGLTKEIDERIAKYGKSVSETKKGRKLSKEHIAKLRGPRKKYKKRSKCTIQ